MSTFDGSRSLSSSSCRTSLPVRFAVVCRRSLTLCQARNHGKSGSLIRSTALLPRSKLGTRHTPDDMYSPTRQPAKRCREPAAFAAADRGDRARRVRGDRHGEATVIPYDAAGASARACGSVEGSTLGAAEVRRLHHSRTTPDSERCSSYETAHRPRAPLPCAIRSGGGPGGVLPLMGVAFPRGLPSHELATSS